MKAACCFCNESIEGSDIFVVKLTNWESKVEARMGEMFCHLNCFKKALHTEMRKIADYIEMHED